MYYNPPANPSPAIGHDASAWTRTHHAVLSGGGASASAGPIPSPSPGYGVPYVNGALHHHPGALVQHQAHQHHHHNSLSQSLTGYPSPPLGPPGMRQNSPPNNGNSQLLSSPHWHQQIMKADTCRSSSSPHHRARASALATRNSTKSAIPITDPNRPIKTPLAIENGNLQDSASSDTTDSESISGPTSSTNGQTSSTSVPSAPGQRSAVRKQESTWATLDMGGIRLKNIAPSLFKYSHLTTLYLNHNHLTAIPPQISLLRALVLLDLTGNQLMSIPPELGLLTYLKELYLFDNHISTLPPELGTLYQLEMLGLEGNPLDTSYKSIVQKDGIGALIAYLRDSCPVPAPPPERTWKSLQSDAERKAQDSDPSIETFTLLCYNILCEYYATPQMYAYTPSWALAWDYRKELILTEIMNYDADFLCLQEMDVGQYEDYFFPHLSAQGYEAVYCPRSRAKTMGESERRRVDGCAIFFKSAKYKLIDKQTIEFNSLALNRPDFEKTDEMFNRMLTKDNIALVSLFEHRVSGSRLIVATVHIASNPEYRDVKLVQVALLIEEVERISAHFAKVPPRQPTEAELASPNPPPRPPAYSDGSKIPTIVCGDFNSVPDSSVYDFLANGSVASDHEDLKSHVYGNFTSSGLRHRLGLRSAYAGIGELPVTNYTPTFRGALDYIWYTSSNITVTSLLGEVDEKYLSKVAGFPNAHFPSDHICVIGEFRIKPPKDTSTIISRPVVFPPTNGVIRNS